MNLWSLALAKDELYQSAYEAVQQGARRFPANSAYKVSITECKLFNNNALSFQGRQWVPDYEPLCISLIQIAYNSLLTSHSGRNETYTIVQCSYFWPNLSNDVRRFVRNCDVYGRMKAWRD